MTDYNDGEWHLWDGRHSPDGVHHESLVTSIFWFDERADRVGVLQDVPAGMVVWSQVIKFRVTKPYREQRVIWVNEYPNGLGFSYPTKEEAQRVVRDAVRIAVQYMEIIE